MENKNKSFIERAIRTLAITIIVLIVYTPVQSQSLDIESKKRIGELFSSYHIPFPGASLLILKKNQILYNQSFGYADVEKQIKVLPVTNFRLASVTKQFTAFCILKMEEERLLKLTDPLSKYFPELPSWANKMTLTHLLQHTSGIADYEPMIPDTVSIPITDIDVIKLLVKTDSTLFTAGGKFSYSNTGYVLLGLIMEKISGMSFFECLKKYVYLPAGMLKSSMNDTRLEVPYRALGYTVTGREIRSTDQSITSYTRGDGAIYSSVSDLLKWDKALYGGSFISSSIIKNMFKAGPDVPSLHPEGNKYGMGWFINEKENAYVHTGNSNGFTNIYIRYPDRHLSIIILTNRTDADLMELWRKLKPILSSY